MRVMMNQSATPPIGRLMKNTQFQPSVSVMMPPASGPITLETPITPPISPMYLARWGGGKRSPITASALVKRHAAPRPCTARATSRTSVPGERPASSEPARKIATPATRTGLRPYRSDSLPQIGSTTVEATR